MHRLLFLFSITILSISFAGCGDGSNNDPDTQENSNNDGDGSGTTEQHTLIITATAPNGFIGDFYINDTPFFLDSSLSSLQLYEHIDAPKCTDTNVCVIEQEWYDKNAVHVSHMLDNGQRGYNNTFIYFEDSSGTNAFVPIYISGVFESTGQTNHTVVWNENQWGANTQGVYIEVNEGSNHHEQEVKTHIEYYQFEGGPYDTQWYEDTHQDWRVCLDLRHTPNHFENAQHVNVVIGDTFTGTRDSDNYTIEGTISEDRQVIEYREIGPGFDYLGRLEFQHD